MELDNEKDSLKLTPSPTAQKELKKRKRRQKKAKKPRTESLKTNYDSGTRSRPNK